MTKTETALEAWRVYTSIGRIDPQLLREPVFRAWERSHLAGVSPRTTRIGSCSRLETERILAANKPLVDAAQPYLRALWRAVGCKRHTTVLGDAQGIVLDLRCDEATMHGPEGVLAPGSRLSEEHVGANCVSTPVKEEAYMELVGSEHFIADFSPFTCQGVPIRGVHGDIIGTLSVSLRSACAAESLRRLLTIAGRGLEADLVVDNLRKRLRQLQRSDTSDDVWKELERLHQDLIQVHTASRLEVELASFEVARGSNAEALVASAHDTIDRFARLSRLWRVLADPTQLVVEELEAGQLIYDSVDLIRTEARIAGVTIHTSVAHHGSVRRVHEAVRALVHGHQAALRQAGLGGTVEITAKERGRVRWTITCADGRQHQRHYDLPGVPS